MHRDIKPATVMVRHDGHVRVLGATIYSRRFEHTEDDLDYARSASAGTAAARVYGEVLHRDDPVLDASAFTPLANIAVRVRGAGFEARPQPMSTAADASAQQGDLRLQGPARRAVNGQPGDDVPSGVADGPTPT